MPKWFDFVATVLVGAGGGNRNGIGSISDGSRMWESGQWLIAGTAGIGERGGLYTVTEQFIKVSEEEVGFSERADGYSKEPVSIHFEFFPETGGADGILIFLVHSGDGCRILSVSEKKNLVRRIKVYSFFSGILIEDIIFIGLQIDFSFLFYSRFWSNRKKFSFFPERKLLILFF